jgi:hypothetical protein
MNRKMMPNGGNILHTAEKVIGRWIPFQAADPTKSAFFGLSAFCLVYCARPGYWIPSFNRPAFRNNGSSDTGYGWQFGGGVTHFQRRAIQVHVIYQRQL